MCKQKIVSALKQFGRWLRYWFYTRPISKPEPLTAKEVISHWVIVEYHGQKINLHEYEVAMWNKLSRKDKRAMAQRTATLEKKGQIKFIDIDGKTTCVQNRDYEKRAEKKREAERGL